LSKAQVAVLISGAALGNCGENSSALAALAALSLLGGVGISLLLVFTQYEETWYKCRAIAESVKTITWRFMARAEPYNSHDRNKVFKLLTTALRKILSEHVNLAENLSGSVSAEDQVTSEMKRIRDASFEMRRSTYVLEVCG
jgi:hypothetical protein